MYISSTVDHERDRSIQSVKNLFQHYLKIAYFNVSLIIIVFVNFIIFRMKNKLFNPFSTGYYYFSQKHNF